MRKRTKRVLIQLIIKLAVVGGVIAALLLWVVSIYPVCGNDMYPALRDGDLCINYRLSQLRENDIVAYRHDGNVFYGRVIGTQGDTIHIDDNSFTVNGMMPSESIYYETRAEEPVDVEVNEGEYFIMNDMRTYNEDSRTFGCVHEGDILGKVTFLFRRRGF
ncbi:MAG: signal peptidase I [Oscillospiraceae bacterium]|nr:signal peptidase I [Oscillospiraceae bacterium]